jgi:hypothetical protein
MTLWSSCAGIKSVSPAFKVFSSSSMNAVNSNIFMLEQFRDRFIAFIRPFDIKKIHIIDLYQENVITYFTIIAKIIKE